MPSNFDIGMYVGLSLTKLISLRDEIEAAIGVTGQISSVNEPSLSVTYNNGNEEPITVKLQAVNYALWKLDPVTFSKPECAKVKRFYTV
jgi:hypothetical protein